MENNTLNEAQAKQILKTKPVVILPSDVPEKTREEALKRAFHVLQQRRG